MYNYSKMPIYIRRTLVNIQSPYQRIELDKTNAGLGLFLDGEIQFLERGERAYHQALAGEPILRNPCAKRALIMGGGDGLAARTMLETKPDMKVFLCELDPTMIKVFSWQNDAVRLNRNSLVKTKVIIDDARSALPLMPPHFFDVVVADFPDYGARTRELYGPRMYREIYRVLKPRGVVSVYSNTAHDVVRASMKGGFDNFRYYPISVPHMGQTAIFSAVRL